MPSPRFKFVVENDSFLRLIQVVLDPHAPKERLDAFAHFCKHDTPDFGAWCDKIRAQAQNLYPTDVQLVDNQGELRANLAGAAVAVVEELSMGLKEIAAAGKSLRFVQKYGVTTRNIDQAACDQAGARVLTIRRRANISTAEQGMMLMLALARQVVLNANLISVEQLTAAGYQPTTYNRAHTPNGNWARIPGMVTLYQRQLGIIGLGEIGRELALRAVAFGMPREAAEHALTLGAAEVLGIDDRYGSLEPGKSATVIVIDGDLLETRMNVKRAYLDGNELDLSSRHTELWKKWSARPALHSAK